MKLQGENDTVVAHITVNSIDRDFSSEAGKAISWAILLSLAVSGGLYYGGKEHLQHLLPPFFANLAVLGSGVICVFSLGCGLHLLFMGSKTNSELRRSLKAQQSALAHLVAEGDEIIRQTETDLSKCALKISSRGIDCLSMARRIIRALDRRLSEIDTFMGTGNAVDLIDADELFRKKLVIADNCLDALIGSDPIPPLAPEEWAPSLKRLFEEVEQEKKKAA